MAEFLGVSRQRVQQIGRAGNLPAPQAVDGIGPWWRYETIETWAVEQWWGRFKWRNRVSMMESAASYAAARAR